MSEPSHCALQVIRITDAQSNGARLYVKIKLGESIRKSCEIDDDGNPSWHDTFTFPRLDPSTVFNIKVKQSHRFLGGALVGLADITVAQLLQKPTEQEVRLNRMRFGRTGHAATIHLSYREIDALSRASIDVKVAEQCVGRIKNSGEKSESAIAVIGSVKEVVDTVVEVVDKVAEIHPLFAISWKAASALYKLVSHQYENDTKLIGMVDQMRNAHDFTNVAKDLKDNGNVIRPKLKELLDETAKCAQFVREYVKYNFAARMARIRDRERLDGFCSRFIDLRRDLESRIGAATAKVADEIRQQQILDAQAVSEARSAVIDMSLVQQLEILEKQLNPFKADASDVSKRPRCLEGTRREYLDAIMDFLSSDSTPNVVWLTGAAGSGKSTIAVTASDRCDDMGCNAAYIFFEREKSEPSSVVRTIAYKLAMLHPPIAPHVSAAFNNNKNINGSTLKRQFEALLLGPLNALKEEGRDRVIIILDALDECGTVEQREELLSLLKNEFAWLPSKVRVLITSRAENDIMKELSSKSHIRHVPLEHKSDQSQHDVSRYIRETMSEVVGKSTTEEVGWDDKMEILCKAADGLFIWASTAVKMVKRSDVMVEQLDALLEDIQSVGEYGIDGLYATALKDSGIMWRSPKSKDRFARVLGLIVLAKEELSIQDIMVFLDLKEELMEATLGRLHSVLSYRPGHPVHIHHASFADYLLSDERSGDQYWHIDEAGQRLAIAERCLEIMVDMLRFNICNIESSFVYNKDIPDLQERIRKNVPVQLSYACRFWAAHVCELQKSDKLAGLLDKLKTFTHTHLLYWFEVLSLTGNYNRVAVRALYEVSLWAAPIDPGLSSFLWAAYRVASVFTFPISQSAPQVYLSAVSLWRGESRVADHYSSTHPYVPMQRHGSKPPAQCIKVIEVVQAGIVSVALSPDGTRLVSGSLDRTVCVWDADTGELVLGPLKGHTGWVNSVAFSRDVRHIVSGSNDKTIRIWNAVTGELVAGPFKGHEKEVTSVAFSPDGNRIASGSFDNTIRIWDVDTGKLVLVPFEGHTSWVNSVGFSPDGTRVVSGSNDKTIRVWDARSGVVIAGPFEGHTNVVTSVAFSPDGSHIVSGSWDETIRVWNAETGELVSGPFEGHTHWVNSVAFSPDGHLVVSGSQDTTVRIWDSDTGELVSGPFEGHTKMVSSVAFSPDGKRAVSGSTDRTVRIWDADSGAVLSSPLNRRDYPVCSVGFSANERRVVSGSKDGTIRVWDIDSGKLVPGTFEGHTDWVCSVALSEDGRLVVSGSDDKTVRVWNASGGELLSGPLEGHTDWVRSVALSRDGNRIVSGSGDKTICIWNAASGELISGPLERHTGWVWSVAFSPDGNFVVSGSHDKSICIWNAVSGALISGPFQAHEGEVTSVAFSPDGGRIASGSDNGAIHIWCAATGELILGPLRGHTDRVRSVAFSSDGKRIVSGSDDKTIRVWDAVSDDLVSTFYGHGGDVLSVAFSADRRHVYSGSRDGTIRTWFVGDGEENILPIVPGITLDADRISEVSSSDSQKTRAITDWKMTEDGWVIGEKGELLTWVPEDMRLTLWQARNTILFGCQFSTRLDFSNAPVGQGWCEGFPRKN